MPSPRRGRGAAAKPAAGKIVRKAVEKLEKPIVRVTGPNRSLPAKVVRVQRRDFHATAQFRRKMAALKKLSDDGKLYKATNPVARDKNLTDGYKDRIRQKIWDKYWPHDKDLANRLSQRLSDYHPDHVWELQLGGPDTVDNLKLLHGRTNTDIGSQIWGQIQNLPDGTPIRIEVVD
ncbi:endonuclease [Micromonospora chalcea]|uniref:endonuclease n=1 Tax=Micromonospora chalcea TaxID=1874 RepID=UPI003456DDDB